MKIDVPELELNKENVMTLFSKCLATKESEMVEQNSFYREVPQYGSVSTRTAPPVPFDIKVLFRHKSLIKYYLGQIKAIHDRKLIMIPSEGLTNYKGERWTDDNRALFALYYLGTACAAFPKFVDGEKYSVTDNLPLFCKAGLKPTFPPSDPRFDMNDAKFALKTLLYTPVTVGGNVRVVKIPELAKLELNKQNVVGIFNKCLATKESKSVKQYSIYDKSSKRTASMVPFDLEKIYNHKALIRYYLGQLDAIHERKPKMTLNDGFNSYKWTKDNKALFALYYMGIASGSFPYFIDGEKEAETDNLLSYYDAGLKSTYRFGHPAFDMDVAKHALKELGVNIEALQL